MPRPTAQTAKPLSLAERKALVAEIAKTASPKVKRGLKLIDFTREATPAVRAAAKKLVPLAKRALERAAHERERAAA